MSVCSITNNVIKGAAIPFAWAGNTPPLKWLAKNYEKDPLKFVGRVSLASVVLKDLLGCIMYVAQSLHNEKIPKEKRGFVASLDLTNGILMIATQIGAFFTISNSKFQNAIFDNTVGHFFNKNARRGFKEKMRSLQCLPKDKQLFQESFKAAENTSRVAFKIFLPLIAATILAKRVVVPLLATPLASWADKKFFHGDDEIKQYYSNRQSLQDTTSLKEMYKNLQNFYNHTLICK